MDVQQMHHVDKVSRFLASVCMCMMKHAMTVLLNSTVFGIRTTLASILTIFSRRPFKKPVKQLVSPTATLLITSNAEGIMCSVFFFIICNYS